MFLIKRREGGAAHEGYVENHIVVEDHNAFRRDAAKYLAQYARVVVRPYPLPPGAPGIGDSYDLARDVFLPRPPTPEPEPEPEPEALGPVVFLAPTEVKVTS